MKIPRELDRRVKISEDQKQTVREMYKNGEAQRAIARGLDISRRMVSFILFPERYEIRRKDGRYYDRAKWREVHKEHMRYKRGIKDRLVG